MLGNGLIMVPRNVAVTIRTALGNSFERLTGVKTPTSIRGLSPRSPALIGLDKLPIKAPHHSIIGDRGRGGFPKQLRRGRTLSERASRFRPIRKDHSLWAWWLPKSRINRGTIANSAPPLGPEG